MSRVARPLQRIALSLPLVAACSPTIADTGSTDSEGDSDSSTSSSTTATLTSSSTASTATVSSSTDSTTASGLTTEPATTATDNTSSSDTTIIDDFPPAGDVGRDGCEDEDCHCSSVDLLFVIDNSVSMDAIQGVLAEAVDPFLRALSDTLEPGTNVHVGVTTTHMGYSGSGSSMTGKTCTFQGDNGDPVDAFYETPDVSDNGRNGAQGRLYDPGSGDYFTSFSSGDNPSTAITWLEGAVAVGVDGSNIEMYSAPVGWAFDPANAATNDGFLRDEGSVLAFFFIGDEPDQTPGVIEASPAATWALERLAEAKENCGGLDCIVAGGLVRDDLCTADGGLPLHGFLDGVGQPSAIETLPADLSDLEAVAEQLEALLSDPFVDAVAQRCEALIPAR